MSLSPEQPSKAADSRQPLSEPQRFRSQSASANGSGQQLWQTLYSSASRHSYLWVQSVGWLWYWVVIFVTITLTSGRSITLGTVHAISESLAGFAITHAMTLIFRRIRHWHVAAQTLSVVILMLAGSSLWNLYKWLTFNAIFHGDLNFPTLSQFGDWYSFSLAIFMAWCSGYFALWHYSLLNKERERSLRLESATKDAQLKMLRYQLNPHFIKNTLNAVSTLVLKKDEATALRVIEKLSNFLNHTIYNDPEELVTVESELAALDEYIAIEQIRFHDKLAILIDCEDDARFCLLPNLLLQPLVENAIKYGTRGGQAVTRVRITLNVIDNLLVAVISDNGPGMAPDLIKNSGKKARNSLGLALTENRLSAHFDERARIEFENLQPCGLAVTVAFPAVYEN